MRRKLGCALFVVCISFGLLCMGQITTWFHVGAIGSEGSVNWTQGWIRVIGCGIPADNATTETQGKLLARRAALMDAQRGLLEVIEGVRVDAHSTMINLMANDAVRTAVSGTLQYAQVVEGSDKWAVPEKRFLFFFKRPGDWREGEYQITLQYNLDHLLLCVYPEGNAVNKGDESGVTAQACDYTGVVIDARGLGIHPSLFIKLVDPQGNPVAEAIAAAYVPSAGYTLSIPDASVENAKNDPRVGDNPLAIQALGLADTPYCLIISQADATSIREIAVATNILMRGGGSVLVVAD